MVSKNQIKLIASLHQKKCRNEHSMFIAEGIKVINELINYGFEAVFVFVIDNSVKINYKAKEVILLSDLKKISALKTPNDSLAVFRIPSQIKVKNSGLIVALDNVKDPGNLGTIIRLCDWFGVNQLICSTETVDMYNPKVIQATMGSIARISINYLDLTDFIKNSNLPVFGAFMDGNNVYKTTLPQNAIIVLGNEANGISKTIENLILNRISIPQFGERQETESLNVAMATSIFLSEFKRNS